MNPDSEDLATHPSLLLRVRDQRDARAWTEFVQVYGPLIFGYCRLKRLQDSDAADVSQEVMLRLSKSMRQFEYQPDRGRFRDWLGKITHRELLRHWKRHRSQPNRTAESEPEPSVEGNEWNDHFHVELLQTALRRIEGDFEGETWRAFELAWIENRSPAEVAMTLNIGINKVYVSQSRVLKRLRVEIMLLCEDLPILK